MSEHSDRKGEKMKKVFLVLIIVLGIVSFVQSEDVTIYDYQTGQFYDYDVQQYGNSMSIYDYKRGTFTDGTTTGNSTTYYDYGTGSFSDMDRTGANSYTGYDYGTGIFQDYNVNSDGSVDVFDYGTVSFMMWNDFTKKNHLGKLRWQARNK